MRSVKITAIIAACVILFATCIDRAETEVDKSISPDITDRQTPGRADIADYAGTAACTSCHQDISRQHKQTTHASTTQTADEQSIKGSFAAGKNTFYYTPELMVKMERRDSGLFQVVYYKSEEKIALPFDMVIGSGNKGQSFMYWKDDALFQLPMTYYTVDHQWANSPGFPGRVLFNRPITARCMECHSTFAEVSPGEAQQPEHFQRGKIFLGVGCEKCHGPGAAHVAFHKSNKNDSVAKFITNPSRLSRAQQIDLCALCHGGRKEPLAAPFTFEAGDTLERFFRIASSAPPVADVHGNQVALLQSSKCYQQSESMTCNTCHAPHVNERGKLDLYSKKCLSCHQQPHAQGFPEKKIAQKAIVSNCIDCHMPAKPSNNIVLQTAAGSRKAAMFRTHYIAIYNDSTGTEPRKPG